MQGSASRLEEWNRLEWPDRRFPTAQRSGPDEVVASVADGVNA
jgi:hypothetical protein